MLPFCDCTILYFDWSSEICQTSQLRSCWYVAFASAGCEAMNDADAMMAADAAMICFLLMRMMILLSVCNILQVKKQ